MGKRKVRVRAAAVVVRQGELLVVRQQVHGRRVRWVLPGGGVDYGESIGEAARREVREETGLDVRIKKLLYIGDFLPGTKHVLDVIFLGHLKGGMPTRQVEEIEAIRFVPLAEVLDLPIAPPAVFERIVEDAPRGFPNDAVYVGPYS